MIMLKMLVLTIKVTHCKCCFLRSRIPVHHVLLNLNIDILPLPKKANIYHANEVCRNLWGGVTSCGNLAA